MLHRRITGWAQAKEEKIIFATVVLSSLLRAGSVCQRQVESRTVVALAVHHLYRCWTLDCALLTSRCTAEDALLMLKSGRKSQHLYDRHKPLESVVSTKKFLVSSRQLDTWHERYHKLCFGTRRLLQNIRTEQVAEAKEMRGHCNGHKPVRVQLVQECLQLSGLHKVRRMTARLSNPQRPGLLREAVYCRFRTLNFASSEGAYSSRKPSLELVFDPEGSTGHSKENLKNA